MPVFSIKLELLGFKDCWKISIDPNEGGVEYQFREFHMCVHQEQYSEHQIDGGIKNSVSIEEPLNMSVLVRN
jgi:hypothetical protein